MNCHGCGVELDPSQEEVNTTIDQILETSLKAEKKGSVPALWPFQGGALLASQGRPIWFAVGLFAR
jgi:hypothetical protein